MSHNDNNPVTEKLCESRRETMKAEINGIKRTIYVTGAVITTAIAIIQVVLKYAL